MEFTHYVQRHALFNWGLRACRFFYSVQDCPRPALVMQKTQEFMNANNPLPVYLADLQSPYSYDEHGQVSFKRFYTDIKGFCTQNAIAFKFSQPAQFRDLIVSLQTSDAGALHRLRLVGTVGSPDESICGIKENK